MKVEQIFIKFYWFGVVLLCAGLIFYGANRYIQMMTERSLLEYEEFREKSIRAAFAIQNHINTEIDSLYQLRDVFRLRGGVLTRSEFGMISGAILSRHDGIQALEWIPWVPHSKRELYEQKAIDEGLKDFGFKAILDDGRVGLSPVQEDYYPVYYIEPLAGNEKAAGLNLASSKPRREALLKSIRTNKAVASEGIRLIQEKKGQNGVLVFLPIDSESDPSLLLGVFRINDMISSTFSNGVQSL
ncbi:CHASE domain-containing protein [Endozoicomonas atrinae]|uniref:CHASE domain-containing protein n=1 Tax=Endozoicomonas atrinae TaxID=1333660 RepID=UPI0008266A1E|nr:CHASE domain-containing protein [Endozoicomonas atrinae]